MISCQIIIDLDEAHGKTLTHEQSAKSNGICLATVTNTVKKYTDGGIKIILDTPVSKNAIRRALKKTNLDLTSTTTGVSHQKMIPNS